MYGQSIEGSICNGIQPAMFEDLRCLRPERAKLPEVEPLEQQMQGARRHGASMLGKGLLVKAAGVESPAGSRPEGDITWGYPRDRSSRMWPSPLGGQAPWGQSRSFRDLSNLT